MNRNSNVKISNKLNVQRINFKNCYKFSNYSQVIEYGEKHKNVDGVIDCIKHLTYDKSDYQLEIDKIVNAEVNTEKEKYTQLEKYNLIKILSLVISNLALITAFFVTDVWKNLFYLITIASVFSFLIYLVRLNNARNKYNLYSKEIYNQLQKSHDQFANLVSSNYKKIDNLYLESLDPAHREAVLTRREQKKHNDKMLEIANENTRIEREKVDTERRKVDNDNRVKSLQSELTQTRGELTKTKELLVRTQGELAAANTELSKIKVDFAKTQDELLKTQNEYITLNKRK